MNRIDTFRGQWEFLSNFHLLNNPIYDDYRIGYTTVENAYQARKTLDRGERQKIRDLPPGKAKLKGRSVALREDWEDIKRAVMLELLLQKFLNNEPCRRRLLATGDALLIEGNNWNDRYWGVSAGVGENHLGKLLMVVRGTLRDD